MINPLSDPTLEHLAKYLYEGLNRLEPRSLASYQILSGTTAPEIQALSKFPMLALHRIRCSGERLQNCTVGLEYILPVAALELQGASFRWVEETVSFLLSEYDLRGDAACKIKLGDLTSEARTVGRSGIVFQILEISFPIVDIVRL